MPFRSAILLGAPVLAGCHRPAPSNRVSAEASVPVVAGSSSPDASAPDGSAASGGKPDAAPTAAPKLPPPLFAVKATGSFDGIA